MNKISKVMFTSFIVNFVLSISKVIFGMIAKSGALLADGVHSFSDLSTDVIAIIGNKLSLKKEDEKHPYGHGKLEYLTSIMIGLIVVILGLVLIFNSFNKKNDSIGPIVAIVSIFTIFFKLLLSRYILKKGYLYKNNILISSGKESSADVISSIVVLASSIFMYFKNEVSIFTYADLVATIIVGLFIIKTGYVILKENISIILGEKETDTEYLKEIEKLIYKNKLVKGIDNLVLLKYGYYYHFSCDLSMDSDISILKAHSELDKIEESLKKFDNKIKYQTIHVNPYIEDNN